MKKHLDDLETGERHGKPLDSDGERLMQEHTRKNLGETSKQYDKLNPNQPKSRELKEQLDEAQKRLDRNESRFRDWNYYGNYGE